MNKLTHNIGVIRGDLNGGTVTDSAIKLSDSASHLLKKPIKHNYLQYNADYFVENNITELGPQELEELAKHDAIFEGAIGDPTKLKPGIIEVGLLLKVRQAFKQRVNLRPVILPEGVESPIRNKDHRHINFEICRENSEGLYVADGKNVNVGTDEEYAEQIMRCSYQGVKKLADFAADRARTRKRFDKPRLHFVFKNNVLTYAAKPWKRAEEATRKENPDIDVRYMHIDNFMMQMVTKPEQFDEVVTENMFGDISTDLGAVIQGGIGTAVSGNINPEGTFPSMYEPIHGSAPDLWYQTDKGTGEYIPGTFCPELVQRVKPEAAFMSYAMMLDQLGETRAATVMRDAALNNIRDKDYKTRTLNDLTNTACNYAKAAQ